MESRIRLTWDEMWHGIHVGCARRMAVLKRGGRDRFGANPELIAWKADIEGACAELAVAKALGVEWPASVDQGSDPDIWSDIEVRRTNPSLILRPNDHKDRRYVWVKGWAPAYEIGGWIKAGDGMRDEWLTDFGKSNRPKCFCVPRERLCKIETLTMPEN